MKDRYAAPAEVTAVAEPDTDQTSNRPRRSRAVLAAAMALVAAAGCDSATPPRPIPTTPPVPAQIFDMTAGYIDAQGKTHHTLIFGTPSGASPDFSPWYVDYGDHVNVECRRPSAIDVNLHPQLYRTRRSINHQWLQVPGPDEILYTFSDAYTNDAPLGTVWDSPDHPPFDPRVPECKDL